MIPTLYQPQMQISHSSHQVSSPINNSSVPMFSAIQTRILSFNGTKFITDGSALRSLERKETCEKLSEKLRAADSTKSELIKTTPSVMVSIKNRKEGTDESIFGQVNKPQPDFTYGLSELNRQTQSRLGSVSKSLTAVLVFAVGLNPNSKLSEYLTHEELSFFDDPERARNTTIAQLLSHRSGLQSNIQPEGEPGEWGQAGMEDKNLESRFLAEGKVKKFSFTHNDGKYHYSNLAYGIIGLILEKREGKSLLELFKEHIFEPIGMSRTTRIFLDENHLSSFDPDGYKNPNGDRPFETDPFNTTAGGLRSCLEDMDLFYNYLYEISCGRKVLGQLNKISFTKMIEPFPKVSIEDKDSYGMGFNNKNGVIGHDGMNGSYLATGNLNLNTGVSSVGFVNAMVETQGAHPDIDSIVPVVKNLSIQHDE